MYCFFSSDILVSQMDGDQYVPIWTVANFNQVTLRRLITKTIIVVRFCHTLWCNLFCVSCSLINQKLWFLSKLSPQFAFVWKWSSLWVPFSKIGFDVLHGWFYWIKAFPVLLGLLVELNQHLVSYCGLSLFHLLDALARNMAYIWIHWKRLNIWFSFPQKLTDKRPFVKREQEDGRAAEAHVFTPPL